MLFVTYHGTITNVILRYYWHRSSCLLFLVGDNCPQIQFCLIYMLDRHWLPKQLISFAVYSFQVRFEMGQIRFFSPQFITGKISLAHKKGMRKSNANSPVPYGIILPIVASVPAFCDNSELFCFIRNDIGISRSFLCGHNPITKTMEKPK